MAPRAYGATGRPDDTQFAGDVGMGKQAVRGMDIEARGAVWGHRVRPDPSPSHSQRTKMGLWSPQGMEAEIGPHAALHAVAVHDDAVVLGGLGALFHVIGRPGRLQPPYGHTAMTRFWPMGAADSVTSRLDPGSAAGHSGRCG